MAKRGLGKGLGALIPSPGPSEAPQVEEILVDDIHPSPDQPRKHFGQQAFEDLVVSVKEFGLIQPVVVRPKGTGFELVVGERRWRAAKEAGLKAIPAVIRGTTDTESLEMALIENIQRENLNALEEAAAFRKLIEQFDMTQAGLASRVGKSRAVIANTLRLLQLPGDVKQLIEDGDLSSGHARALLSLDDEERQKKLAQRIITEGLSVRQTENIVRLMSLPGPRTHRPLQPKAFKAIAKKLGERLSAKVRVSMTSKKGKIEIDFKSLDDLERIYELLVEGAHLEK